MKTDDKVLFDRAKTRIDGSKLDDHSKEGISVALAMSGEACNGMKESEKMETLTRAVFSLTLAVSYFMAQAPDHTNKCINDAIEGHVGSCAKLMASQKRERPVKQDGGSSVSFSLKEGVKAHGIAAVVVAAVVAVVLSLFGIARWQESKTREAVEQMFNARVGEMVQKHAEK